MAIKQENFEDDKQPPVNSDWLNSVTKEINNAIKPFQALLEGENTQLFESLIKITLGKFSCKLDSTSTSTQYNLIFSEPSINILPQSLNYFNGMIIWIDNTIENTGISKVNLLNKGSKNILKNDGTPLQPGDLKIGLLALMYDEVLNGFRKCNIV